MFLLRFRRDMQGRGAHAALWGRGKNNRRHDSKGHQATGVMEAAAAAGKQLGERLRNGHDRKAVTQKMQQTLMQMFSESA